MNLEPEQASMFQPQLKLNIFCLELFDKLLLLR